MQELVDELTGLVRERKIRWWGVRDCSICESPIGYVFEPNGNVFFDGSCDCSRGSDLRPSSMNDVAYHIERQDPKIRERLLSEFRCLGADPSQPEVDA